MKLTQIETGEALRLLRQLHRLEQHEVAAALNVSQAIISLWESGTTPIKPRRQEQLQSFFAARQLPSETRRGIEELTQNSESMTNIREDRK